MSEFPALDFRPLRDRSAAPTLVQQVADAVVRAIESRVLAPGMALPSVREFARAYEISTFTVASAYARLVSQGWLLARPGSGYRVAPRVAAGVSAPTPRPWEPPTPGAEWLLSDVFADHSIPVKSGCGWLPGEWLNEGGLHLGLRHVARVPGGRIAGYGHPYGYVPLRETVAAQAASLGMPVDIGQVLLTQGVTHGLDIAIRTLLRPGDTVIVEQPCYANLLALVRLAGLHAVAVRRTPEGMDIAELEQAVQAHRPRAMIINTVLQNPTGTSLAMANAYQVLRIAEQQDCWIIEDDISRELAPGVAPVLGALDGLRRVVYLSGYSKVISPSVRVGYAIAHPDVVRDMARTKMAVGLTSPEIMERVVHEALHEGRYRAHVAGLRERLALAHAKVARRLAETGMPLHAEPRAGLFLWARLPEAGGLAGANAMAERALRDGIWLAPGSYFDAAQRDLPWIRLNVAYSDDERLWRFLRQEIHGAGAASDRVSRLTG
ncbi:PLP-dependent aminotransferase family protein [Bordetella bronchialis]|uniref:GntR family transcriptional regulator n=1 Tax=Bordetella bronchialis TaxID=463025 RepID=A0ABN4R1J9_9BORD|nr:PLP-dependent aminotransferase family protein [Bordetella bronchialis]ANN65326.1 GntR family transcriptional regulator [Bordetella bronchialis]